MEYTQIIAFIASVIGIGFAIYSFISKRKIEEKFETILKEKRIELQKELLEASQKYLEQRAKTDINYYKKVNELILEINKKELDIFQEKMKYEIFATLSKKERELLEENLEQKYLSGQVDYLNKLINMSGSTQSIKLIEKD